MPRILLFLFLILCSTLQLSAQKVKYKDLFVFLNAENFTEGDRYLRIFLANEPDHPNANFYMGMMLQSYLADIDMLQETERFGLVADSSVMFYEKSKGLITEKEVKKHDDDYYAAYRRRDMRTGKFEVTISDVYLKIEQSVNEVQESKQNSILLSSLVATATGYYEDCLEIYAMLATSYPSQNDLLLMSDKTTVELLDELIIKYDSSLSNIAKYGEILGKKGFITLNNVDSFPNDDQQLADFFTEPVVLSDFGSWAAVSMGKIEQDIVQIRELLVIHDTELDILYNECLSDSSDVRPRAFELATNQVPRALLQYDEAPFTRALFDYKISELNYFSTLFQWHLLVEDSADVGYQIVVLDELQHQQSELAQLLNSLQEIDMTLPQRRYQDFLESRYGGLSDYQGYLSERDNLVTKQQTYLDQTMSYLLEADKFAIYHGDSISLSARGYYQNDSLGYSYTTLRLDSMDLRTLKAYGIYQHADATAIFSFLAPSSRQVEEVSFFLLDTAFNALDLVNVETLSLANDDGQLTWIISKSNNDALNTFTTQVVQLSMDNAVSWSQTYQLAARPIEIALSSDSGLLNISAHGEELLLALNETGENQYIIPQDDLNEPIQTIIASDTVVSDTTQVGGL